MLIHPHLRVNVLKRFICGLANAGLRRVLDSVLLDGVARDSFVEKISKRPKIKVEIGRREAEMAGQFMDLGLQLHEGITHVLDLIVSQRTAFHAANGLPLQQLSQQLNQAEN
jgi:hypothetical protein